MAQIRELKIRMTAVRTIARITKTMQMIATAKFTAALQRARATRPYTDSIRKLVAEVCAAAGDVEHPLLRARSESHGKHLMLVISSDRGLCGAYNGNVLRRGAAHYRHMISNGDSVRLEISGKKGVAFCKFQKIEVAHRHALGDKPSFESVEAIAQRIIDEFVAGAYETVSVVYTRYASASRQVPEVMQLLPLTPTSEGDADLEGAAGDQAGTPVTQYEFSPSADELLDSLLPRSVKVSLFQAFNDAIVSEHAMRRIAMKAATDNAVGVSKSISRSYNRARQAKITTELTEIVSGAAALD